MNRLPCLLLPLWLAAASGHAEERLTYACDNGENLVLSFGEAADGRPQATIHHPAGDRVLPQVAAASGARYRAEPVDLHTKGDAAVYVDEQGRQYRCARGTRAAAVAPPAAASSSFITLSGGVAYRTRNALPPDAILTIRVRDAASRPQRVLAEQHYELNGAQVPIFFSTTIDRDLVGKRARVQVVAEIAINGAVHYINDRAYPALRDGQPLPLAIMLKPVAPPRH